MSYTFGDNDEASLRLRRLAEIYEPEMRSLLQRARETGKAEGATLAVDLGCGPGWSTQLLHSVLKPQRTVGLELSDRYVAEARALHPELTFLQHNILEAPFPVERPNLLHCRFLLTHLINPQRALQVWAEVAASDALLLIHETERIESPDPVLSRYYELLDQMQRHYGQDLNVGGMLDGCFPAHGWRMVSSVSQMAEKPAHCMAQLHLPNLRTWGKNEYASQAFDRRELDELEAALEGIASGGAGGAVVYNTARQIIAERL